MQRAHGHHIHVYMLKSIPRLKMIIKIIYVHKGSLRSPICVKTSDSRDNSWETAYDRWECYLLVLFGEVKMPAHAYHTTGMLQGSKHSCLGPYSLINFSSSTCINFSKSWISLFHYSNTASCSGSVWSVCRVWNYRTVIDSWLPMLLHSAKQDCNSWARVWKPLICHYNQFSV